MTDVYISDNLARSDPYGDFGTCGRAEALTGLFRCSGNTHVFYNGSHLCQCGARNLRKQYCGVCGKETGCRECGK